MFHGDTLYAESEVLEVRPSQSKPDRGVVKVRTDVYNQRNELVATFRRAVLVPKRPPEPRGDRSGPIADSAPMRQNPASTQR